MLAILVLGAILVAPLAVRACQMPVFRYALERWRPDVLEMAVLFRGMLTEEEKTLAEELRKRPAGNYELRLVDLDKAKAEEEDWKRLWEKRAGLADKAAAERPAGPLVVLRSAAVDGRKTVLWSGPLSREAIEPVLQSPARREIARRLMAGESVVFVVLRSGGESDQADEAFGKRLDEQLAGLQKKIKLPAGIGEDDSPLLSTLPVEIRFSRLDVRRDDGAERAFVAALLAQRSELAETRTPIVFPVFGRGRVLDGLADEDARPEMVEEAAKYLAAACSCQVKELNPGFDVLIAANWDQVLERPAKAAAGKTTGGAAKDAEGGGAAADPKGTLPGGAKTASGPKYVPIPGAAASGASESGGDALAKPSEAADAGRAISWAYFAGAAAGVALVVLAVRMIVSPRG